MISTLFREAACTNFARAISTDIPGSGHTSMVSSTSFLVVVFAVMVTPAAGQQPAESCSHNGGTWLEKYKECEYASRESCRTLGGHFDECGSACRHVLNPGPCTMQCVPVCQFTTHMKCNDAMNCTYAIDGRPIVLKNGEAKEEAAQGSAILETTRILDATTTGDLNRDGLRGIVVLLVQNAGGSGSFYYVAAVLGVKDGYRATNALLIGDRVMPQATEVHDGTIVVNYKERYPWESFAVLPSVSRTRYFLVENDELKEKPFAVLDEGVAKKLAISRWGDCQRKTCSKLTVRILDGRGGVWYVEAIYEGTEDDATRIRRTIAEAYYKDEGWQLGKVLLTEQACRTRTGHETFSTDECR